MKLQFCGAARTVTGSCYYLEVGDVRFLVDCGIFQGSKELDELNRKDFPFDPSKLDFVLLTHAHFDHTGRLPILVKQGFHGKIISTQPTRELAEIVLLDAAHLQKEEFERWQSRVNLNEQENERKYGTNPSAEGSLYESREPLYSEDDVRKTIGLFEVYPYGQSVKIRDNVEFRMRDSGHILGSASFELWLTNQNGQQRKIVFSGDLGQPGQRIIRDPDMMREADYVVVESTYGNRLHKSKDETILEFLSVLKAAQKDGGNLLIPSFAIERTQEILYEMNLFVENKLIDNLEVYLDSPMAIKATEVFQRYPTYYDEDARRLLEKGDDPFNFKGLTLIDAVEDSKRLISKKGVVIIAGSGMANGGRIIHHLANNLGNPSAHVVFVGYQVEGTLGRRIVDREPVVRVKGREIEVRAQIHTLGGFSAHADERDLRYWLRGFGHSPKQIFVTHGEESIAISFAHNIEEELHVQATIPKLFDVVELE